MEGYIAQIIMFGGNFAPRNWAFCDGQSLLIASYTALFSLLGTSFGGDGRTTFALPDMRGRVSIHPGTGPGLSSYNLGARGGSERVTLTLANLPSHNHIATTTINAVAGQATQSSPAGNFLAVAPDEVYAATGSTAAMNAASAQTTVAAAGGSQAFSVMQPYLAVNYIICLFGTFPSRN